MTALTRKHVMADVRTQTVAVLCILLVGSAHAEEAASDAVTRLTAGSAVEREAAVGETHRYSIDMRAGQYVQLLVEQRGADVAATVSGPDGHVLLAMDNGPCGVIGPDPVDFVAPADGTYEVKLVVGEIAVAPRGRYEIRAETVREPQARDLVRVKAVQASASAWRLFPKDAAAGLSHFREAAALWGDAGDRRMQMWMEMAVGVAAAQGFDRYEEARESYRRPLATAIELGDEWAEARLRFNMAQAIRRLGQLDEAKEHFDRALSLHRAAGREVAAARVLTSLGSFYGLAGEPQRALDLLGEALRTFESAGITRNAAIVRFDIAGLYVRLREPELALEQYRLALPAFAQEPAYRAQAIAGTGRAHFQLGEVARAREAYTEALGIFKTVGNRVAEADTYLSLGDLHMDEGDLQAALDVFAAALAAHRSRAYVLGEAFTQCRLGEVHRRRADLTAARAAFEAALAAAPGASVFVSACAEAGLARVAADEGELAAARIHAQKALATAESLRARLASPQTRAATLASQQSVYELLIDVLMRWHEREPSAGHDAAAFEISERARARSLLEVLAEGHVNIRQGIDGGLLAEETSLRRTVNIKAQEQAQAVVAGRSQQVEALGREVDSLLARLAEVETRIRRRSPRYAALTQPQPLTLAEIRAQVLDPDTQLLQYTLGDTRSYAWVVSPAGVQSFALAPRAEIERAARRLHELVTAPAVAAADVGAPRAREAALRELSRLVVAPVATTLTAKRLVVVAPGALQYVPFAALPVAERLGDRSPVPGSPATAAAITPPLVSRFELVSAPSASVIATLRRDSSRSGQPMKVAAVFADPVFEASDPRLAAARSDPPEPSAQVASRGTVEAAVLDQALRAVRGGRAGGLVRLPFSRQEADAIVVLAARGQSLRATGFDANRAAATSPRVADYRIVHFATHGVLNSRRPELSGVVLSLLDRAGKKQDGFLRLHDIYNLELSADLVVLSGCQTALGKDLAGEGLVGLTRGFMYAGAPRVVASLWQVDDESTAELMKRFYRAMLKDRRRPAEALRTAQLELSRQPRWSAPFHWAGFVLQGEWR